MTLYFDSIAPAKSAMEKKAPPIFLSQCRDGGGPTTVIVNTAHPDFVKAAATIKIALMATDDALAHEALLSAFQQEMSRNWQAAMGNSRLVQDMSHKATQLVRRAFARMQG